MGWRPGPRVVRSIKLVLAIVILMAVGSQVGRTIQALGNHEAAVRVDGRSLSIAVLTYVLGLGAFGTYFFRLLRASQRPLAFQPAIRAYLISHLGKYVPGKAMVVVMRAALSAPYGARPATAALATLYETLVMMAGGGFIAAIGFAWPPFRWMTFRLGSRFEMDIPLALLGLIAGLGFLFLVEVRVFRKLLALVSLPFRGVGPDALPRLSWGLLAEGLCWSVLGWVLLGLSQVAVLWAIVPGGVPVRAWPAIIASVALATVAGFAVPVVPGGLGVREFVLWTGLGTTFVDQDHAVVAALMLRLTWVMGEVLVASLLAPFRAPRIDWDQS